MHRRLLLVLVAVVLLAVPVFANHSWGNYHWARTSNPFTVKIHENMTAVWEPYLANAVQDWNASNVFAFSVLWDSPLTTARKCGSTAGRIEICNTKYGQNGWLGIAGISISGSHITKAYTKLNDTYYAMAQYNTPAWRQMVVCQEIAHDIGLDHQDEAFDNANLGSCMDYTNDPDGGAGGASSNDPSNESPNSHDFQQIATIYSHTDSTTTLSSLFDIMGDAALHVPTMEEIVNDTESFGAPVKWDAHGRANVFVRQIGVEHKGGDDERTPGHLNPAVQLEITHVFWVPERLLPGVDKPARDNAK